jgi:TrmH family RNA methyltransferase
LDLKRLFRDARRDPELAVLEGLHALKHALRFGAEVQLVAVADPERVRRLAQALAPDVAGRLLESAQVVSPEVFADLAPQPRAGGLSTGVIALARRARFDLDALLADGRPAPIVLLEDPTDLGNLGACVRVAAAADIAGVLSTGVHDPWDPAALRGGAGLHYALPVGRVGAGALTWLGRAQADSPGGAGAGAHGPRPLVAVDPDGAELRPAQLPARAILAFGSERRGLSTELLARAEERVRLPMRAGVSSLNLATSVAALLYAWRLA